MAVLDFVAAGPNTYDHATGGGAYNNRTIGKGTPGQPDDPVLADSDADDVVESLEGGDFATGDIVTFFVAINADDLNVDWSDVDGSASVYLSTQFLADATGQSGIGFSEIVNVDVNAGTVVNGEGANGEDTGHIDDGNASATLESQTLTDPFDGGTLEGEIRVDGVDSGDVIIVRIDVLLDDDGDPATEATGNLQAAITDASVSYTDLSGLEQSDKIRVGNQTVPLKKVDQVETVPDLAFDKSVVDVGGDGADGIVDEAGDVIAYRLTVTNTGNTSLTDVQVDDPLLSDLAYQSGDTDGDGELDVGETWTYTGSYTATQSDIDDNGGGDGDIDNTASVTTAEGAGAEDSEEVAIARNPAVELVKTAALADGGSAVDAAGDVIDYTIAVTNTGNTTLTDVQVDDPLLADLAYQSGDTDGDGALDVGETWTYTGSYTATQSDIDDNGGGDGDIDNTASVTTAQNVGDTDSEEVAIARNPAIELVKTAALADGGSAVDAAGDVIDYTIAVTNTGNTTLTDVQVDDPLLADLAYQSGDADGDGALDVGETWTYTGSYTATQSDIDDNGGGDGDIDNTASVTTAQNVGDTDSEEVVIARNPAIDLVKTAALADGGAAVDAAGDVIDYTIAVTNTGNTTLTDVQVDDPLLSDLAYQSGDTDGDGELDVGETWTYTGSYTATQSDIDDNGGGDGDIDNTASVTTTEGAGDEDSEEVVIARNPAIDLVKTAALADGGAAVDAAGDVIDYTIAVTNTGNTTLTDVQVDDPLLADLAYQSGDTDGDGALDVGETWTYTGSYTATQSDIDNNGGGDGDIDNTASVTTAQNVGDTDSEEVAIARNPAIELVKTAALADGGAAVDAAGDVIDYTIAVTNTGNTTLTDVKVDDPLLVDLAYQSGDTDGDGELDVGETWTYTGSYTATQSDIDANGGGDGDIDNTASVTTAQNVGDTDSEEVAIARNPAIDLVKTAALADGGSAVDAAGDVIDYTIAVTNTGNTTLTDVQVDDPLLSDLAYQSGDTDGDGQLDVGETWTYTGSYTATQSDIDDNGGGDGDIDNTASVTTAEGAGDTDSEEVAIARNPAIDLVKTAALADGGSAVDAAGDVIDYTIAVTNTGNTTLTDVQVDDPLLSDLAYQSGDTDGDGELDVGETWTYTGSYTATQSDIDDNGGGDGDIDNTASVTTAEGAGDEDSEEVAIARNPAVDLVKTAALADGGSAVDAAGDVIDYTIAVTNTGNTTLTDVQVDDPLLSDLAYQSGDTDGDGALDVGETWTYTGSYTATQSDIDDNGGGDGDIDNTASVTTAEGAGDTDSEEVAIARNPAIDLVKTAALADGGAAVDAAGDVIDYTIAVTNTGNTTLTDVQVDDPLLADLAYQSGDTDGDGELDVGETWTYTGSYTATQSDIDANGGGDGDIDNTASVTTAEGAGDEDSEEVAIARNPAIELVKTAALADGGAVVDAAGDVINYVIAVTNTGNTTLTDVQVDDPRLPDLVYRSGDADGDGELDVDETWTYEGSYVVLQSDLEDNGGGDGDIDNTASVTTAQNVGDTDSVAVDIVQSPAIALNKSGEWLDDLGVSGRAEVGETVTYRFTAYNDGNVSLGGIELSDAMLGLDGFAFDQLDGFTGDFDNDGRLDIGEVWVGTWDYQLTEDDIAAEGITNVATVSGSPSGPTGPVTDTDVDDLFLPAKQRSIAQTIDPVAYKIDSDGDGGYEGIAGTVTITDKSEPGLTLSLSDFDLTGLVKGRRGFESELDLELTSLAADLDGDGEAEIELTDADPLTDGFQFSLAVLEPDNDVTLHFQATTANGDALPNKFKLGSMLEVSGGHQVFETFQAFQLNQLEEYSL